MEQLYKITQVRKKYNISARTLRWYEEKGLIESQRIPGYTYRVYTKDMVRKLEYILYFRKMGIGLQEIDFILKNNSLELINKFIKEKRFQIDGQIQHLNRQREAMLGNFMSFSKSLDSEKEEILAKVRQKKHEWIDLGTMKCVDREGRIYQGSAENYQIKNGTVDLWDEERCVFTKECFTPPVTFHVDIISKHNPKNIRLHFGPLELFLGWPDAPNTLVLYDHSRSDILRATVDEKIMQKPLVEMAWYISDNVISTAINHQPVFSLERKYVDWEQHSLGFGTREGNQITLQQATAFTLDGAQPLDLRAVNAKPTVTIQYQEGELTIHHIGDTLQMVTQEEYALPCIITVIAKVSSENLRLFYKNGVLILNWEKSRLLWWDPVTKEERIFKQLGYITPDEYHTVRQIFTGSAYVLEIDGITHLIVRDLPYMEQMQQGIVIKGHVGIGTAFSNTVTVQELSVTQLVEIY